MCLTTEIESPCHKSFEDNSLPSSSLVSIKSLAQSSNSSQLSSTTWLIFVLALRLRLSILLWCKEGHQPHLTRMKQRRRMRRCNAGEAMAHNLQSTVPEREREINELLQQISLALLYVPIVLLFFGFFPNLVIIWCHRYQSQIWDQAIS